MLNLRSRLLAALAITAGVGGLAGVGFGADRLDGVQSRWEDLLQPGLDDAPDVVVVAIDRASLSAIDEQWPWSRTRHAQLLDAIGAAGPRAVLYDVLFADARPGDDVLAAAVGRTPTVLGAALTLRPHDDAPPDVIEIVPPTAALVDTATDIGHLNVTAAQESGVVRSLPLYGLDERGIALASIVLATVAVADGTTGPLTERPDGVQIGERFVPLTADAELRVNWSGALAPDQSVPAIDVLDGTADPARFAGKVVVVGVTEPTLGDQHLVPTDRTGGTSGVYVLANATNTILTAGYVAPSSATAVVVAILLLAAIVAACFAFVRLTVAGIVALGLAAAYVLFAAWRFHAAGQLWNVVWPVLAVVLAAAMGTTWRYVTETRHRRQAWRLFSTYVPASVVAQMEDPRRLAAAVEGSRVEVSVLFCDLRGFTPVAATLEPPQVRQLLDTYYDYAVRTIHRHRGTVMQFVGDEVFAVFGAPVADPDAGAAAVRCALELQDGIGELDGRLVGGGLPTIRYGIGMHRGMVVAAHVGTHDRRQYSVVGDTVNVGSRLCSQARAGEVVASPAAAAAAPELAARLVADGEVTLKGVAAPMPIHRATSGASTLVG